MKTNNFLLTNERIELYHTKYRYLIYASIFYTLILANHWLDKNYNLCLFVSISYLLQNIFAYGIKTIIVN